MAPQTAGIENSRCKKLQMMGKVLAIVVTYNAMPWLKKCLGSLRDSTVPVDIFVADNGSTDGTREYVRTHFPEAVLVCDDGNPGFGAANNKGFRYALGKGYDFVYLLNQDAWVEKDTIEKLLAAFRGKTEEYAVLSPLQFDASGKLDARFENKCGKALKRAGFPRTDSADVVPVPFVMAAHWLLSCKAIRTIGGFSPAFRQYGEDDNYIDRMHWRGLKAGVVTSAAAVHDRAGRTIPKDRRMKLKCVSSVVRMSDPERCFAIEKFIEPLRLAGMAAKNFSCVPLRFIPELLSRCGELKEKRRESFETGAFL